MFDGVIYLKVLLNDEFEARFIVDTGADSISAVSTALATTMGVLDPEIKSRAGSGARRGEIRRLYGTRMSIEGVQFTGFDFIALPLGKLEPYWGRKIDGLLGGNILKDFVLTIDYENRILILADQSSVKDRHAGFRLPMSIMGTTPLIEAHVGKHGETVNIPGRFIVDTGVRVSFFNTPFTRRHRLLEQSPRSIENITGYGIGGMIVDNVGRVAYLDLGGARLKEPVLQLSSSDEGLRASPLFDGIIGGDLLSRFTVTFDFPGKALYLKANKQFKNPFLYDMSGIYFTMEAGCSSGAVRVANVVVNSPASLSGVSRGDVIREVDGRPVSDFSMSLLKDYFKQEGKKVNLKLERNGKIMNVTLVLVPFV